MDAKNSRMSAGRLALLVVVASASVCLAGPPESDFVGPLPRRPEPKPVAPPVPAPFAAPATPPAESATARETASTAAQPAAPSATTLAAPLVKPRIESLPLGKTEPTRAANDVVAAKPSSGLSLGGTQTIIALTGVLTLVFLAAGLFKRYSKLGGGLTSALGAGGRAPSGILQVLGRYPAGKGITLVLLRVDRRVLLVTQSKITGLGRMSGGLSMSVLSEITDPSDVASIVAKASAADGSSPSAHFNAALEEASATDDEPPRRAMPRAPIVAKLAAPRRVIEDASALAELLPVSARQQQAAQPVRPSAASNTARKEAAVADLRQRLASMRANTATVQVKLGARKATEVTA